MPVLELTDVIAWALVAGGIGFAALLSRGLPAAAVTAGLAALAVKTVLMDLT